MRKFWNIREKIASHPQTRGWFMGKFFPENDFFHSENVELKFSEHKKWSHYIGSTTDKYRKTVAILIAWKVEYSFGDNQKILLENPFDFIADDEIPGHHAMEVLEDCVLLVVREQFEN